MKIKKIAENTFLERKSAIPMEFGYVVRSAIVLTLCSKYRYFTQFEIAYKRQKSFNIA